MTDPLVKPKKKNPVERTRLPTRPPAPRSRAAQGLTRAAAEGVFEMQTCGDCGALQYPPREVCHQCLSERLVWKDADPRGTLIATTVLRHSNDLYFRERLPWKVGTVKMAAGPSVVAHVHEDCAEGGAVRLALKLDRSGQAVLHALPEKDTPNMNDAPQLRESTCDPKFRRVLVSDGKSAMGLAVARAMLDAGANAVFLGDPTSWKTVKAFDALVASDPRVQPVELDVTDTDSVDRLAASIGGKVEILVNTAAYLRDGGILGRKDVILARDAFEVNVLGMMRLAQAFGPGMGFRAADGSNNAVAWVNILSIHALAALPARGAWSASMAAALSAAQTLRAEFAGAGVRVMNVFPGPIDEEWEQLTPPPKLAPAAVAKAIVQGLQGGLEDVYVGDIAEELRTRLRENHKAVERELGQ
ncbi:SDR family NAD(P)-dependent oxidoreductase [Cognatazoarcus halotolerans]|uniref:SDR family NAD(P)-dependent oxidoreductase n=1 Tax=Cognatazoarcus halotolerans TaxID=2686016 RepID=UPI001358A959|nr:SDR family NAD(P)-dependent oxidoreductase [Cognatazoarcus halotolerans]MCB1899761.1 SDR family NAD(P)-dependent oxidoreductase [Rhodocyclaceae bacterium]